jgi:hypothetical protein
MSVATHSRSRHSLYILEPHAHRTQNSKCAAHSTACQFFAPARAPAHFSKKIFKKFSIFKNLYYYLEMIRNYFYNSRKCRPAQTSAPKKVTCTHAHARTFFKISQYRFAHKSPHLHTKSLLFSCGTFDSFLAGLCRNWAYTACCPAQTAYKPV